MIGVNKMLRIVEDTIDGRFRQLKCKSQTIMSLILFDNEDF